MPCYSLSFSLLSSRCCAVFIGVEKGSSLAGSFCRPSFGAQNKASPHSFFKNVMVGKPLYATAQALIGKAVVAGLI